jgi:hypothetical protein
MYKKISEEEYEVTLSGGKSITVRDPNRLLHEISNEKLIAKALELEALTIASIDQSDGPLTQGSIENARKVTS